MCEPWPRTMYSGSPPTLPNARTGEFTPPGMNRSARLCSLRDCSVLRAIIPPAILAIGRRRSVSPNVVVAVAASELYFKPEQLAQASRLQYFFFISVSHDPAIRQEHDPFDLGNDVRKLMGDKNDPNPRIRQRAHGLPQTVLRQNIQRVAGLVE